MKLEQWLRDVHYDKWVTCIWSKDEDGGNQMVADIRGWGAWLGGLPSSQPSIFSKYYSLADSSFLCSNVGNLLYNFN